MSKFAYDNSDRLAATSNGDSSIYDLHCDHLGSPRRVTDGGMCGASGGCWNRARGR